jgi:hypothetical protein
MQYMLFQLVYKLDYRENVGLNQQRSIDNSEPVPPPHTTASASFQLNGNSCLYC